MKISSSVESSLIVLSGLPKIIDVSEPFMNLKVVKSSISNQFLDDGLRISVRSNSIFESESFSFFVSIKACLDRFRD